MRLLACWIFALAACTHAAPPAAVEDAELFPAVTLDRAAGHVEVRGQVIGGPVEWLELLACRPGTREHESVVTLDARAEHLHAALLLLGLTPGTPADAHWEGDTLVQIPPRGPGLGVFFIFDDAPDRPVPAGVYVADQATGDPLDPSRPPGARSPAVQAAVEPGGGWLFAGSRLVEARERSYFLAEENGTLISLVNFGDDLIARDTSQAADGGNGLWTLNRDPEGWPALPAAGTALTVRLTRVWGPSEDDAHGPLERPASPDNVRKSAPGR